MSISKFAFADGARERFDRAQNNVAVARDKYTDARNSFSAAYERIVAALPEHEVNRASRSVAEEAAEKVLSSEEYRAMRSAWTLAEHALKSLRAVCGQQASKMRKLFDAADEEWADSEEGGAVYAWIDELDCFELPERLPTKSVHDLASHAVSRGWYDAAELFEHGHEDAFEAAMGLSSSPELSYSKACVG